MTAERHVALDRESAFPAAICMALDRSGLHTYYVPDAWGGRLRHYEDLLQLLRQVARRDLTAAAAHAKTYLGSVCVWLAGEPRQATSLAAAVLSGSVVAWALSERHHGADLMAGEVTARRDGDAYVLDGEKWLINNATRGTHVCVLARTDSTRAAGPGRGFSLFLVEKAAVGHERCRPLPKVRTHGIRGADISGLSLDGVRVGADTLVGAEGGGVQTVLLALQLTRTVSSALSLGAADQAILLAARFTAERVIRDRPLIERARVRSVLRRAAAVLFAVEASTVVAARCVQTMPGEMSVVSAIVKAVAPSLVDEMIDELAELIGMRSFMNAEYASGAYQKLQRDHKIVGIFDGSTVVNRAALVNQFPRLVSRYASRAYDEGGLAASADLSAYPASANLGDLRLLSPQGCSVVQAMPGLVDRIEQDARQGRVPTDVAADARTILDNTTALHTAMAAIRPRMNPSAVAYELAADYELAFEAAASMALWQANHELPAFREHPLWVQAGWLQITLSEIAGRMVRDGRPAPVEMPNGVLERLVTGDGIVSILPAAFTVTVAHGGHDD